jgi:predicted ATP-dependent protease
MSSTSKIPLLSEKHSGIPQNLLEKAMNAKALIYKTRTKEADTRKRLLVLPQGVGKDTFVQALDELGEQLGRDNVEVNDRPLVDGWYMERKYSCFLLIIL